MGASRDVTTAPGVGRLPAGGFFQLRRFAVDEIATRIMEVSAVVLYVAMASWLAHGAVMLYRRIRSML